MLNSVEEHKKSRTLSGKEIMAIMGYSSIRSAQRLKRRVLVALGRPNGRYLMREELDWWLRG